MRFFNTAGPVKPEDHYCVPPLERLDLEELLLLIAQKKYFVLHAPRQTGKTSCLLALRDYLNSQGRYCCLYVNVEIGQSAREDVDAAMRAILSELASAARYVLNESFLDDIWLQVLAESGGHAALGEVLTRWASHTDKPLVLLIDEIDALIGDTLISVLRQLRVGYAKRPHEFPQSIILCGVRDVRDYRIHSAAEKTIITGGSAFNIKAKSLRLGDLCRSELILLYQQHTAETGQVFESAALDKIWHLTQGQPWLSNALGYELCFEMRANRDRKRHLTAAMVDEAKENLIQRRETHLDQLVDKLQEERVRRVIEPLLNSESLAEDIRPDDVAYLIDLGLIRRDRAGGVQISNPIYQEVIPRELAWTIQSGIAQEPVWYIAADGRLQVSKLLTAFQAFFREHSEHWLERYHYKEAGPQLLMQAFLQRIVNGGGRIEREYALGRRRTDLLVIWPYSGGVQKAVIELKMLYKSLERTIDEGLIQTRDYMDHCAAEEGHLLIFDRRSGRAWDDKLFRRRERVQGYTITVWGM